MGTDVAAVGLCQTAGPHGDQREQPEQCRGGPEYGEVGPLALGFDAKMGAYFLKGGFHPPSEHEPLRDLPGSK
jgi:hypothetical protein